MNVIKTKAFVEDAEHLKLSQKLDSVKSGTEVELTIILKDDGNRNHWKQILLSIGTYNDEDLSGFREAKEDFNSWRPIEY